jgi:TraM recognition site of TraD and TraG
VNAFLGRDRKSGKKVYIPKSSFDTHWHLIGSTGKGKTTAIHALLHPLLLDPCATDCWFIIDRMGNFSSELLLWMASDFCTQDVRDRLLYIEPAREDVVIGFNPLLYDTQGHGYYKVSRGVEVILRGWASQNIQEMPRLAMWTYNAFWAAAQLGLTIADCVHFLLPFSPYHKRLLECLPEKLRYEWEEIMKSRSSEVLRILESTRNRLRPYFEQIILRRMFGSTRNRLDVSRMMREGRIVLINLASKNRIDLQCADAIGGLILNEVLATARSLEPWQRTPTYLLLDEFQRFVGTDMEEALPEVRQLGVKLLLAHQSFSQLERGDHDLTNMIFQAQSRMIFGLQGEDADLVAQELASLTFDPKVIKDEIRTKRQRQAGHEKVLLHSWSESEAEGKTWGNTSGTDSGGSESTVTHADHLSPDVRSKGTSRRRSESKSDGGQRTRTKTQGTQEHLVPIIEDFEEVSSRSYYAFDEMMRCWARDVRQRQTGDCYLRLVDDSTVYDVHVQRSAPGVLSWDAVTLRREFPQALDAVGELIEKNFRSDFFVSPEEIDRESRERLDAVLRPPIVVENPTTPQLPPPPPPSVFSD